MLANRKKDFSIKKSILGWKSATDNAAFQSSLQIQAGDTLKLFALRATNIYITL